MAKLVYALNMSLDGYVDHMRLGPPEPEVFRHFTECVRTAAGLLYGRGLYEVMRYWDVEQQGWGEDERAYAQVWRRQPKWVVSRTLTSVGPNASVVQGDLAAFVARLKAEREGDIDVGGPILAKSLGELELIDEYQLYLHPVALGAGSPYFVGPTPRLRYLRSDPIGQDVMRLTYARA